MSIRALVVCAFISISSTCAHGADAPRFQWQFHKERIESRSVLPISGDTSAQILGDVKLSDASSALQLDGQNNRVLVTADIQSVDMPTKGLAAEAWVKVNKIQEWGGIVGAIQDNGSYERGWLLGFRNDRFCLAIASQKSQRLTYLSSETGFVPGAWYHVCGTYDGETMRLFVDGELAASSTAQTGDIVYPPKTWFEIGTYHDDNELYPLQGAIAEVTVFDQAISDKSIIERFQAGKDRFPGIDPVEVAVNGWPTYMHDSERTGMTSESLTLPLHEVWRYRAAHAPNPAWPAPAKQDFWHNKYDLQARVIYDRAAHVVSDGARVVFGSSADDKVYCLDLTSGKLQWEFSTEGPVRLAPTIDDGRVFVGSDDGCVYCLEAETGKLVWRFRAGEGDRRMPGNGRIISTWPVRTGVVVESGQARFAAGLFPLQGVFQYALDAKTGQELAKGKLAFSPQGYMQRRGGNIMVSQGRAPTTKLAEVAATIKQKITAAGKPTDDYPLATIRAGDVRFRGGAGKVAAFDLAAEPLWESVVQGDAYSLAVAGGSLLVSTSEGVIHCFRAEAGALNRWNMQEVKAEPSVADDRFENLASSLEGIDQGYGLVLVDDPAQLAADIASQTRLQLVCVVSDPAQLAAARRTVDLASLGGRVSVHHAAGDRLPYVSKLFNLVVVEPHSADGTEKTSAREVHRLLRPGGGRAIVLQSTVADNPNARDQWAAKLPKDEVDQSGSDRGLLVVARKALPNAGRWTHIYASPDNTACSGDENVAGNVKLQWFGKPGPREMLDRHHRTVPPLYVDGVMFVPGNDRVYGVDAYNGTVLWNSEVANSRRVAAMRDAGSMAASAEYLYVAAGDRCYGLASKTGEFALNFPVPVAKDQQPRDWGFVAYVGERLFGSSTRQNASRGEHSREQIKETYYDSVAVVTSDTVFSMDRFGGDLKWRYDAQGGAIANPTMTLGDGRVYFVESTNKATLAEPSGRSKLGDLFAGKANLVALDMQSGEVLWREAFDLRELQHQVFLSYSDGKLVLVGTKNKKDNLRQFVWYDLHGFDAASGKHVWSATQNQRVGVNGDHGEQDHHPTIVNGTVYQQPFAYDLHTGKRREAWQFARGGHGCGALSASAKAVYFRAGNPTMCDLETGKNEKITQVSRPGCWINIIPAGGLLMIPEASSGCTCNFPIQASIVFAPAEQ